MLSTFYENIYFITLLVNFVNLICLTSYHVPICEICKYNYVIIIIVAWEFTENQIHFCIFNLALEIREC